MIKKRITVKTDLCKICECKKLLLCAMQKQETHLKNDMEVLI